MFDKWSGPANLHGVRNVIANFDPSLPPWSEGPPVVGPSDVMNVMRCYVSGHQTPGIRPPYLPASDHWTQARPPSVSVI